MAFSTDKTRQGAAGVSTGYEIPYSLRFSGDAGGEPKLTWTPSSDPTSRRAHTVSFWIKRGELEAYQTVISAGGRWDTMIGFNAGASNKDTMTMLTNYAENGRAIETEARFRDASAWYHVVGTWDSENVTSTDRHILWVNGVRQTVGSEVALPQDVDTMLMADATEITIGMGGRYQYNVRLDAYLAEFHCIDGQVLTPTEFGETGAYGEWKPKEYAGTYGDNGFYLDFADSGNLGDDESGNGNDFSANDIAATDQMLDTPTNNFCTWNPLNLDVAGTGTISLEEGNLKHLNHNDAGGKGTMLIPETGKWYWEYFMGDVGLNCGPGIIDATTADAGNGSLGTNGRFTYRGFNGGANGNGTAINFGYSYTDGDIISVAFDADNDAIYFAKNGTWQGDQSDIGAAGDPTSGASKTGQAFPTGVGDYGNYVPVGCGAGGDNIFLANFGQDSSFAGEKTAQGNQDANEIGDFYYTVPADYLALCTANLDTPAVKPQEYFNTVIYEGTGSAFGVTGVGFQPDLILAKNRDDTYDPSMVNAVSGTSKYQRVNSTGTEYTTTQVSAFGADGFTLGTEEEFNPSGGGGQSMVAWNWKANGSGSANTVGDEDSTVSANTDAGFSIVQYEATGSATTVGHGLSKAPEFIVVKHLDQAGTSWMVYHKLGRDPEVDETNYLKFNSNIAELDDINTWNDTVATSTVFSIGPTGGDTNNTSGGTTVAYCWHSVDGYSKVGSYTGNGDDDGVFNYCGFRPAWVMIKRINAVNDWYVHDNVRTPTNPTGTIIKTNTYAVEATETYFQIDILSNGFKLRASDPAINTSGEYLFMAFAETPFKYSNAR